MNYCRKCPKCQKDIFHKNEKALYLSSWRKSFCRSCSQQGHKVSIQTRKKQSLLKLGKILSDEHCKNISIAISGENHPFYGKHHSEEMKRKQSERYKGRTLSKETKEKLKKSSILAWKDPIIREKYINSIVISGWNNVRCDIGQLELIEKWNRLGFQFEPNFQIKIDKNLFYIDGYDKEHNVVLEFDSKYHNRLSQISSDLYRQEKIIKALNPKRFWRFKADKNIFIECITKTTSRL